MKEIFFIDPMSYGTIAKYDKCLLEGIVDTNPKDMVIDYFCSYLNPYIFDRPIKRYRIFFYNKLPTSILKGLSYVVSYMIIVLYIIVKKPTCIHIQWIRRPSIDLLFLKFCRILNIKVIYTAHNVLPHNDHSESTQRAYENYYKNVDEIIVHSPSTKSELHSIFSLPLSKIHVVYHGLLPLEVHKDSVDEQIEKISKKVNIKNKLVFTCLGVQSAYKGVDIVLNVWKNYKELNSNPEIMLVIAGKGKNIDFSILDGFTNVYIENDYISDADYLAYLRLSSATLLPYRTISQSGALLTALSEKVPVIVSNVGGLPDPLSIADVGWNIGEPKAENLASVLIELVQNPENIWGKRTNSEAWQKLFGGLSWTQIGDLTSKIYHS